MLKKCFLGTTCIVINRYIFISTYFQLIRWPSFSFSRHTIVLGLLACMSFQGVTNLKQQWGIIGEFSNYPLEQMVEWINRSTPQSELIQKVFLFY